jgi:hypothetical protein
MLGIGGGYAYDHHYARTIDSINQTIAHAPQSNAAALAFRHGSPEHARALLSVVPISDDNDMFHWGDHLVRDLRLAVICKEQQDASGEAAYLASAVEDWRHLGKQPCTLEYMSRAAGKFAKLRTP